MVCDLRKAVVKLLTRLLNFSLTLFFCLSSSCEVVGWHGSPVWGGSMDPLHS